MGTHPGNFFLNPSLTANHSCGVCDNCNKDNTFHQLLLFQPRQNNTTPPNQSSNESHAMLPRPSRPVEAESSRKGPNRATKTNARKRNVEHITNEDDKKINNCFATLSCMLERKKVEEDECNEYAKLLAKKVTEISRKNARQDHLQN